MGLIVITDVLFWYNLSEVIGIIYVCRLTLSDAIIMVVIITVNNEVLLSLSDPCASHLAAMSNKNYLFVVFGNLSCSVSFQIVVCLLLYRGEIKFFRRHV